MKQEECVLRYRRRLPAFAAVAVALAVLACDSWAPFEPEFTNNADDLQLQITGITPGVSGAEEVTWQNTGVLATVNQSSQLTGGTGTLTIRDAYGTLVYTGDLADNGSFVSTPAGVAGAWTVRVEADNLSGTVSVRIQRGSWQPTP
jgi:hypothetical protein